MENIRNKNVLKCLLLRHFHKIYNFIVLFKVHFIKIINDLFLKKPAASDIHKKNIAAIKTCEHTYKPHIKTSAE